MVTNWEQSKGAPAQNAQVLSITAELARVLGGTIRLFGAERVKWDEIGGEARGRALLSGSAVQPGSRWAHPHMCAHTGMHMHAHTHRHAPMCTVFSSCQHVWVTLGGQRGQRQPQPVALHLFLL